MRRLSFWGGVGLVLIGLGCSPASPRSAPESSGGPPKTEVEIAQEAVEKGPGFIAYTNLGFALTRAGRGPEAVRAFERSAEVSPRSPTAFSNVCSAYNSLGQWVDAIENCNRALVLEPNFVLAKNNLAFAEKSRTAEEAGLRFVEKRVGAGGVASRRRLDLGMAYYREDHYEKAVALWKEIPSSSTYYALAQNDLASAYILLKKFGQAKVHLDRALRLKPKDELFLNNRHWLEMAKRDSKNLATKVGQPR